MRSPGKPTFCFSHNHWALEWYLTALDALINFGGSCVAPRIIGFCRWCWSIIPVGSESLEDFQVSKSGPSLVHSKTSFKVFFFFSTAAKLVGLLLVSSTYRHLLEQFKELISHEGKVNALLLVGKSFFHSWPPLPSCYLNMLNIQNLLNTQRVLDSVQSQTYLTSSNVLLVGYGFLRTLPRNLWGNERSRQHDSLKGTAVE